jgi:ElaB/YqjD/DUF883 family membrane-anchored ribosome-binding protein
MPTVVDTNSLSLELLRKALLSGGEIKLIGNAKDALLSGKISKSKEQVIKFIIDDKKLLARTREAQEGKGAKSKTVQFVKITDDGISFLVENSKPTDRRQLLESCAQIHKSTIFQAIAAASKNKLKEIETSIHKLASESKDVVRAVQDLAKSQLDFISKLLKEYEKEKSSLVIEPLDKEDVEGLQKAKMLVSRTDGEKNFQRQMCAELVLTWKEYPEPEIRSALEQAMSNTGMEQLGESGQIVNFDNKFHETKDDLLPNDKARVVSPGWSYVTEQGAIQISRVQVERLC